MNYWSIFLTGLLTGGLTCLAVQGGLLASVIANQKKAGTSKFEKPHTLVDKETILPVLMFMAAKLISHMMLGFFLGALGSVLTLSLGVRLGFQVFAAAFMFATAMNLLNVHPLFRYLSFQSPRFMQRFIRKQSKNEALFAPAVLGFLTIFIPCGITQAVEVTVIANGHALAGALAMGAFVLGTGPIFTLVGVATSKLSDMWSQRFSLVAAMTLIFMSFYTVNGVLTVLNFPLTFSSIADNVEEAFTPPSIYAKRLAERQRNKTVVERGVQKVTINVTATGYSPKYITVKKGVPVDLTLQSNDAYSCASEFVMKAFNINTRLKPTDTKTITFTPQQAGKFQFSCAMGMYRGTFEVQG
jgi:sulfite exporter TauE/SafE